MIVPPHSGSSSQFILSFDLKVRMVGYEQLTEETERIPVMVVMMFGRKSRLI